MNKLQKLVFSFSLMVTKVTEFGIEGLLSYLNVHPPPTPFLGD